jgi:hypothetical protein
MIFIDGCSIEALPCHRFDLICTINVAPDLHICLRQLAICALSWICHVSRSLVVRGLVLGNGEQLDRALARKGQLNDNAVVHLVIRRTAKVDLSVKGSKFELSISASDSADTVKRWALLFVNILLCAATSTCSRLDCVAINEYWEVTWLSGRLC